MYLCPKLPPYLFFSHTPSASKPSTPEPRACSCSLINHQKGPRYIRKRARCIRIRERALSIRTRPLTNPRVDYWYHYCPPHLARYEWENRPLYLRSRTHSAVGVSMLRASTHLQISQCVLCVWVIWIPVCVWACTWVPVCVWVSSLQDGDGYYIVRMRSVYAGIQNDASAYFTVCVVCMSHMHPSVCLSVYMSPSVRISIVIAGWWMVLHWVYALCVRKHTKIQVWGW